MTVFQLHNEAGIDFPPLRPAYEEGEILFGRFRTLTPRDAKNSIIGEGGTGLIHLVRDELMDRVVALKLPHESILRDASARYDVIRETRQAIELTHPNIVRIHDFHENAVSWGISMQYVRGKNLDEWRHENGDGSRRGGSRRGIVPYSVERIEGWIAQLCNALMYAHEDAHMVHRDIKPKNLMLEIRDDGYEKLLLTDFGITQKLRLHTMMLSRVQPGSNEKSTMGTLPYMSWEQILGAPASTLDDIYSVGATIYELLTGRPPFYEGAYEQIRTQVEKVVPPGMRERLEQFDLAIHPIPDAWEETVAACLAKRPEDRPQSMREILTRLGLAGGAAPAPAAEPEPTVSPLEINTLRENLQSREEQVTSLQTELANRHAEIAALQAQLQESVSKTAALEKAIDESRLALGDVRNLEGEHQQQLADLRSELQEKDRQRDQIQSTLATLEQQLQTAEQTRAALENELSTARDASRAAEAAAAAKITEVERSAGERIQEIEAATRARLEEARQAALEATELAEKAARRKTGRALAEAIAAAEVAKLHAANLAGETRHHAAAAERAEKELAALKSSTAAPSAAPSGSG